MSDTVQGFRDLREYRKLERQRLGVECPRCRKERPRANASKLLPGQRCRIDSYVDERKPEV